MASSTGVWYAVSNSGRPGAVVSIANLNLPQPAYTKEGGASASGYSAAQESCASYFDLLMQLLPMPRHSSSSPGCSAGNNTLQSGSPSQPQPTANNMEPLWVDDDERDLTYTPVYADSSSTQHGLPLGKLLSSNVESLWDDDDTHLTYVPTYSNSTTPQQSSPMGTPQSRRPAAIVCPPAPIRPRPTMLLVPAEELHVCIE